MIIPSTFDSESNITFSYIDHTRICKQNRIQSLHKL